MRRRQCRCAAGRRRAGWGIGRGPAGRAMQRTGAGLAQRGSSTSGRQTAGTRSPPPASARTASARTRASASPPGESPKREADGRPSAPPAGAVGYERRPPGCASHWEWRHCTALRIANSAPCGTYVPSGTRGEGYSRGTPGVLRGYSRGHAVSDVPSGTRGSSRCRSTRGCFGSAPTRPKSAAVRSLKVRQGCCRCNHHWERRRAKRLCAALVRADAAAGTAERRMPSASATSRAELTLINLSAAAAPRGCSGTIDEAFSAVDGISFPSTRVPPWYPLG